MAIQNIEIDLADLEYPFKATSGKGHVFYEAGGRLVASGVLSYVQNFWPITSGQWASIVSSRQSVPVLPSEVLTSFNTYAPQVARVVQNGKQTYICDNGSYLVCYDSFAGVWVTLVTSPSVTEFAIPVLLKGQTYIFRRNDALYEFDPTKKDADDRFTAITSVALTGIDPTVMIGMCGSKGYLIFADEKNVYWSAPFNNTYFTVGGVGANYGAGTTQVLDITSDIIAVQGGKNGFYIYTINEVVKATYSGNAANPWIFELVTNASGCLSANYIAASLRADTQFYWSESGLATVQDTAVNYPLQSVTEYLAGDVRINYDQLTHTLQRTLGVEYEIDIVYAGKRYLAISYWLTGEPRNKIILIDVVTGSAFEITVPHLVVFEVILPEASIELVWDEATMTWDEAAMTWATLLGTDNFSQSNTIGIGIMTPEGFLHRISPLDISVSADNVSTLPNVLMLENLNLARSVESVIHGLTIHSTIPAWQDNTEYASNDASAVYCTSEHEQQMEVMDVLESWDTAVSWQSLEIQGKNLKVAVENVSTVSKLIIQLDSVGKGVL